MLKSIQHDIHEHNKHMRKEFHELKEDQKKMYDHMMAKEGGGTSTHVVDDDPDDDETLSAFIAHRRGKTIIIDESDDNNTESSWGVGGLQPSQPHTGSALGNKYWKI